jgi:dTDP-4-dehydrorhamnose reductase
MILLLGAGGYVGSGFARELRSRDREFVAPRHGELDASRFDSLLAWLRARRPEFVVNCAGYTGKPNVDACESDRAGTLAGNVLLPQTLAHACAAAGIPWGHVSSGCIYSGAKVRGDDGKTRVEKDLMAPGVRRLWEGARDRLSGFTEDDAPNFSFRDDPCSFYSGSKALGEEAIAGVGESYVWRLRIPFDHRDGSRNYLSKVQRYSRVYDNVNSISHLGDFVSACLDCWDQRVPWGTYNVTNPGFVTTRDVVAAIEARLRPGRKFEFWQDDEEFYRIAAKTPRSNCILDGEKLARAGIRVRPVAEALEDSLARWTPETTPAA